MKRSNSTSMITELLSSMEKDAACPGSSRRRNSFGQQTGLKGKRLLSASNVSLPSEHHQSTGAGSMNAGTASSGYSVWSSPVKQQYQPLSSPLPITRINSPTSRVVQLRKEESLDERLREAEQDREVTSQIQLNQSWNELKLDDDDIRPEMMETLPCPVAMTTGLQFSTPSSPVNISSRVRSRSLTPTSPSSSRTFTYRRSLSPAPLRPSSLVFQPQRKRQRNSDQNEEMDISPTQLHPPAKRAVFQSPLTAPPTSCTSPLLTTQINCCASDKVDHEEELQHFHQEVLHTSEQLPPPPPLITRPAFDTSQFQAYHTSDNHHLSSYDHTHHHTHHSPASSLSSYVRKHNPHNQCMETSAFLPFKTANGMTTPPSTAQLQVDETHFEPITSSLNPVTTIS